MTPQAPLQGRLPLLAGTTPPPAPKRAVAPATAQQSGSSRWTSTHGGRGTPPPPTREHAHEGDTTAWAPSTTRVHGDAGPHHDRLMGSRHPLQRPTVAPCRGASRRARPANPCPKNGESVGQRFAGSLFPAAAAPLAASSHHPWWWFRPPRSTSLDPRGEGQITVFGAFSRGGPLPGFFLTAPPIRTS